MRKAIFSAILLIIFKSNIFAVPAVPTPFTVKQADGTEVTVRLYGDEHFSYATTEDGFLVMQNSENIWVFAEIDNNENIVPTSAIARSKRFLPKDRLKHIENINRNVDLQNIALRRQTERIATSKKQILQYERRLNSFSGTMRAIVILVNFNDRQFVVSNPRQAFSNLLNQMNYSANGATGSAREYFIDNSNEIFTPQFDVYGPYTLSQNMVYYGANDNNGNDLRPDAMVSEACNLAYNDPDVDFSRYDYDDDGIVDQVFIYYAGNNEAEGASKNTIWPHRSEVWSGVGTGSNRMYIQDYACASELRGNISQPNYMCGIGTFVHEFGHILGLPDLYNTVDNLYAMGEWDVMDAGCYLNNGKTPPGYSSYERFYSGWLTPRIINEPENVILSPLNTGNEALLVSETGTNNLNGANPVPNLFYMLENRQQTGWDTYLPASGLLITKVNFNAYRWNWNIVNNNSSDLGVDIIEADKIANYYSTSGDPFPGSRHADSYDIVFNSATKSLTEIAESDEIITFKFMGGTSVAPNIQAGKPQLFIEGDNLIVKTQDFYVRQISIFNIEGKQIYSSNFINSFKLNKNNFPSGIYIVKTGNFIGKLIF